MARTSSHPASHWESLLGTRGILHVNSQNKPMVRSWCISRGLPGWKAHKLANPQLAHAYNDNDKRGGDGYLNWMIKQAAIEIAQGTAVAVVMDDESDDAAFETPHTDTAPIVPLVPVIAGNGHDIQPATVSAISNGNGHVMSQDQGNVGDTSEKSLQLAKLLMEITNRPQGVDAKAVTDIIDSKWLELPDLIARYSPITTIVVKGADAIERKVDGHVHPEFKTLLCAMSSRQHNGFRPNIMLVGPTGSGKTHAVGQAAAAMGLEFRSNGAISMDHQLIGYRDANGVYHETPFSQAFTTACVYLFDEMDASDNSPLLALAGALANGHFDFPHGRFPRHPDCIMVGAGNTWGLSATSDFVGRNKLDGAIRSRFPIRIRWEIDESLERNICGNIDWACRVQKARHKAKAAGLKVIIDPRMSQAGAALIANGMTMDDAARITYLADLSDDQRKIVES